MKPVTSSNATGRGAGSSAPRESLLAAALLAAALAGVAMADPASIHAQETRAQATSERLRFPPIDTTRYPIIFGLTRLPPFHRLSAEWRRLDPVLMPRSFREWVDERIAAAAALAATQPRLRPFGEAREPSELAVEPPTTEQAVPPRTAFLPPVVERDTSRNELLPGALGRYADIWMMVSGYGEMGGSWTRFRPCDPSLHLDCNPGLFPQIKPDVQFSVNVGGTISERIYLNVDYDQSREETLNSNVINVFYQGLPDEVLQRLEVGDVQFSLPQSRYLTQSIPAGNFGFMADGQLGPMRFQTVWAQQRGDLTTREFQLDGGGQQGLVQDDEIVLDDADYVKGQFFFLVHPDSLAGAPHVDALLLRSTDAPVTLRPEQGGIIQVYRDERIPPASGQQQVNLFLANADAADGTLRHSGQFRRLDPEQDYLVHPSGLWIMLRSPLRTEEALAVAYVTESGDTVGTVNAEQSAGGTPPTLRLIRSPFASHQPGRPTWDFELHQVYRVNSSSGVETSSIELRISLGGVVGGRTFVAANGRQVTFLRLFGLDEDAPADRVDNAQVFQPETVFGTTGSGSRIAGTYVMFPTLEPFREPPPVPIENLTAVETLALLGNDANATIYTNTDPVIREGAGRFRLNLNYRVRVEGLVSSFNLGNFGIRDGSERITVGDRRLERGIDYTIDYEIGQVTLSDPGSVFGAAAAAPLRATWEQRSLFQIAPTSIFGANLTWGLGRHGTINAVGLYQSQRTLYSRPQLGTEPGSNFLGGLSAQLDLGGQYLDRWLASVPGLRNGGISRVSLNMEVATSLPNPNRRDQGYFEDFEDAEGIPLDVRRQQWRLGSRPESTTGDDGRLPVSPDATNATRLVWQHDYTSPEGGTQGSILPEAIDRQINIIGNSFPEPAMWLQFGHREPAGTPVWRSITTVLSTTGRDMTRDEYFEFYVRQGGPEPLALIFDFGTVGEDAMYIDSTGATSGQYPDGRLWGLGRFDEEASTADREVWGATADARGLWDQPCQAQPLQAYPLGDERANCTRGNGVPDTEDLDGNGVLEENDGAYFRYVVPLDDPMSPLLVRDTIQTGTLYRLYRVPLRSGTAVNGASDGTFRFIRHLRMTVVGEPAGGRKTIVLARMRIVGSSWTKRDLSGIVHGLLGEEPGSATAELQVGPVSRLTDGAAYVPPPGVIDQLQDPSAQFGGSGIEVNEKSQRLRYTALDVNDRAEAYFRYPQQPRSFMTYRQLRLWALPRAGDWGANGAQRLVVKIGSDPRNYYLYQTRLPDAVTGQVREIDWLPEIVIDFDRWFALRVEAEGRGSRGAAGVGDTVWSADSAYAIVLDDLARAPNLASVREVAIAVWNGGSASVDGEVWIDDIRLDGAVRDPGASAYIGMDVAGGDVFNATVGYANQGAAFRQLGQEASFINAGDFNMSGTARVDRMLPAAWGLDMPVSFSHMRAARTPTFLERSDVQAGGLDGLRDSGAGSTSIGVRLSKRTPSDNTLVGLLVDGTSLSFAYNNAHTNTITTRNESGAVRGGVDYRKDIALVDVDIMPGFLVNVLRALTPAAIEESAFFGRIADARLRVTPLRVGFGTSYGNANARSFRYATILEDTADLRLLPIESPRRTLDNTADITFQPLESIQAGLNLRSGRDLLSPGQATPEPRIQQALRAARSSIGGADVGWETNRAMTSTLSLRPTVASWIRPSWTFTNRFQTDRDPSYIELQEAQGDTVAVLQRRFGSDRIIQRRLDLQPATLARGLAVDSTGAGALLRRALGAVQAVTISWNSQISSQFDRETFAPGSSYQLGLGGFDGFRALGDDTAANAFDRDDLRIGSTLGLPLGSTFSVTYTDASNRGFDLRGGQRAQRQTTWPDLRLTWRDIPVPSFLSGVLLAAQAGAGYRRLDRTSTLGTRTPQVRALDESSLTPELSLTFAGGVLARYNATFSEGRTTDPTGNGEQNGTNHTVSVSASIQPPSFLAAKMNSPLAASFSFMQDDQRRCRFRPGSGAGTDCVAFIDSSNRSVNLRLDTRLSDINVGFLLDWTDRQTRVGTRAGSSQFQLKLFGQFQFEQGRIPGR